VWAESSFLGPFASPAPAQHRAPAARAHLASTSTLHCRVDPSGQTNPHLLPSSSSRNKPRGISSMNAAAYATSVRILFEHINPLPLTSPPHPSTRRHYLAQVVAAWVIRTSTTGRHHYTARFAASPLKVAGGGDKGSPSELGLWSLPRNHRATGGPGFQAACRRPNCAAVVRHCSFLCRATVKHSSMFFLALISLAIRACAW
jgi:hypothetical protein